MNEVDNLIKIAYNQLTTRLGKSALERLTEILVEKEIATIKITKSDRAKKKTTEAD